MANLLENALKFTPSGGGITLALDRLPDRVNGRTLLSLVVSDTGTGIAANDMAHLLSLIHI